jgi:crotonobetainyl-CoA:carnitine CoA-transferase CaiB-like acyl-CoA transferase
VILEGFRPGISGELGIGYDKIKEINPGIIYCSISGYGQDGPYRDRPGHDVNYLGHSGLLSLEKDITEHRMPAVPMADLAGSMFAAVSILSAIIYRQKSGKGQFLDVSMTACLFSWMGGSLAVGLQSFGEDASLYIPHYGVFETRDKKFITLGIVHEEHFWKKLCGVIDMGEFAGMNILDRIVKRDEISAALKSAFLAKDLGEWTAMLNMADVPFGPVQSIDETCSDPQMKHRDMVYKTGRADDGGCIQRGFPVKFSESGVRRELPPPDFGQSTRDILLSLGYSDDEVNRLKNDKII